MPIEELSSKGSAQCKEAFAFLRDNLNSLGNVEETVEYEPLKESEASTYNVNGTPRVRVFFGEKLEIFLFIPEKSVASIKSDSAVPESLRTWVDRAQLGNEPVASRPVSNQARC